MSTIRVRMGVAGLLLVFILANPSSVAAKKAAAVTVNESKRQQAERLVRDALAAEIRGMDAHRNQLLKQALSIDPDFQPARWHTGQVNLDGNWHSLAELESMVATDQRLQVYEKLRKSSRATPGDEELLARWCSKQGLEYYAKLHWLNVLQSAPRHKAAMRALGVRWYQGQLLTREQVVLQKVAGRRARKAKNYWKPRLQEWTLAIQRDDQYARQRALRNLRGITDPTAIPWLEKYVSRPYPDLAQEVVAALGEIEEHPATLSLARHAVLCKSERTRDTACNLLTKRPLHDYVPVLLDEMSMPIELAGRVQLLPGYGGVQFSYYLFREAWGAEFEQNLTEVQAVNPGTHDRRNLAIFQNRLQLAANMERNIAHANGVAAQLNDRIAYVLANVTGENLGNSPDSWWDWWTDYNEFQQTEKPRFVEHRSIRRTYPEVRRSSCFPAGTLVWTRTGQRPIETVKAGDGVLSQNPETGELTFRPVLTTTVRPPSPTLSVRVGNETIQTTLGHPMWVVGQGWKMAKLLKSGQRLHSLEGGAVIHGIEPSGNAQAFNLVVGEFNTYFVGNSGILVHDNTPRKPTRALVPGLLAE